MPIEGFVIASGDIKRSDDAMMREPQTPEEVNARFVEVYEEIAARSGTIVAEHSVQVRDFQDTHLIVDFPEAKQ